MQYVVPERQNLFDMARIMHRDKLLHGSGIQPVLVSSTHPVRAEDTEGGVFSVSNHRVGH